MLMITTNHHQELQLLLKRALHEDIPAGDITAQCLGLSNTQTEATLIARQPGLFFGVDIIQAIVAMVDPPIKYQCRVSDGALFMANQPLCVFQGDLSRLLQLERVMLNLIQHLSGVATRTSEFVSGLDNPEIDVLDTRKTTPGLRFLEKQAVCAGGGKNHRHSLSDMVLIKENHLRCFLAKFSLSELEIHLEAFRHLNPNILIEVEIESYDQLRQFPLSPVQIVLLDNFPLSDLPNAISFLQKQYPDILIEVSGNITLESIGQYRSFEIHRISVGALTHSVPIVNMSLLFKEDV
jgi:nicotinate-nucleotide pyrophosphorylase (carboxylating)